MLTLYHLKKVLTYNPITGVFYWNISNNGKLGEIAGTLRKDGYVRISLLGKMYYAHQLAWFYTYGEFPTYADGHLDHMNQVKSDNRIINLRPIDRSDNKLNGKIYSSNTSGYPGVTFQGGKWLARISYKGKRKLLGLYTNFEQARDARRTAEVELGIHRPLP